MQRMRLLVFPIEPGGLVWLKKDGDEWSGFTFLEPCSNAQSTEVAICDFAGFEYHIYFCHIANSDRVERPERFPGQNVKRVDLWALPYLPMEPMVRKCLMLLAQTDSIISATGREPLRFGQRELLAA